MTPPFDQRRGLTRRSFLALGCLVTFAATMGAGLGGIGSWLIASEKERLQFRGTLGLLMRRLASLRSTEDDLDRIPTMSVTAVPTAGAKSDSSVTPEATLQFNAPNATPTATGADRSTAPANDTPIPRTPQIKVTSEKELAHQDGNILNGVRRYSSARRYATQTIASSTTPCPTVHRN